MAKRKKKSSGEVACGYPGEGSGRISVSIQPADNGSVIEVSHEGKDGYKRRTLVAPSHARAVRIAASHIRSLGEKSKAKHKKSRHKVSAAKSL